MVSDGRAASARAGRVPMSGVVLKAPSRISGDSRGRQWERMGSGGRLPKGGRDTSPVRLGTRTSDIADGANAYSGPAQDGHSLGNDADPWVPPARARGRVVDRIRAPTGLGLRTAGRWPELGRGIRKLAPVVPRPARSEVRTTDVEPRAERAPADGQHAKAVSGPVPVGGVRQLAAGRCPAPRRSRQRPPQQLLGERPRALPLRPPAGQYIGERASEGPRRPSRPGLHEER